MPLRLLKCVLLLPLFGSLTGMAQDYLVVTPINYPVSNKTFRLSIGNCDSTLLFTCPPTNNILQITENQYLDIAIDKDSNIWYIRSGKSLPEEAE